MPLAVPGRHWQPVLNQGDQWESTSTPDSTQLAARHSGSPIHIHPKRASRAWRIASAESGAELVTSEAAIAAASSGSSPSDAPGELRPLAAQSMLKQSSPQRGSSTEERDCCEDLRRTKRSLSALHDPHRGGVGAPARADRASRVRSAVAASVQHTDGRRRVRCVRAELGATRPARAGRSW